MTSPAPVNTRSPFATSAISGHFDTRTAATEIADKIFDDLGPGGEPDLLLLFGSFHHRSAFDEAAALIHKTVSPRTMLGVTAEAVLGNDQELDGVAGMTAMALRVPGVVLHPWRALPDDPMPMDDVAKVRERIGLTEANAKDFRTAIMFADPFTTPITRLLPALNRAMAGRRQFAGAEPAAEGESAVELPFLCPSRIIGGLASGASQPGLNVLVQNDRVISAGAIGVSVFAGSANIDVDFIVSQGCRPIGQTFVITKSKGNVILELGGRKAIEALQEMAQELSDSDKRLLSRGLLIGTVINEYKDRFGRGDFLIRSVMGMDQKVGGIAVGEMCRVGQTVQFHVRDAATAAEDLQLLLDGQAMNPNPALAAMLFSCNGRGERLFGVPNHDVSIIRDRLGEVPIAGFFAAGELGPIGDRSFLHGHTASLAVVRTSST
jgi:small ligand-binding sensory domain FIST